MKATTKLFSNIALLILRLVIGLMMIFGHGWGKLVKIIDGNWTFPEIFGMPSQVSLIFAVFLEVGCSLLLIIGYKTRIAAILLFFMMLSAVTIIHDTDPLFTSQANSGGSKELAVLYGVAYFTLALMGGGKYAIGQK